MKAVELAELAMRFVARVHIGDTTGAGPSSASPLHASMTLLRLPDRRVGVTCQHVVEAYRERRRRNSSCTFQVGAAPLEPEERVVAEERFLDLAILDLEDLEGMEAGALAVEGRPVDFFEPAAWPLGSAQARELVGLAGYGVTRVIDAGAENIVCDVAAGSRAHETGAPHAPAARALGDGASSEAPVDALAALGGLSGGAGLVRRGSEVQLAGVIFAVARSGAYLRLRPARFIRRDGTLLPRGSR